MEKEQEGSSRGTCIKDRRRKTMGGGLNVVGGRWLDQGRVMGREMGTNVTEQQ